MYKRVDKRIFTNTADGHCSMDTRGGAGINDEWELLCNVTVFLYRRFLLWKVTPLKSAEMHLLWF